MWVFIIIIFGIVLSVFGLTQYIRQRKYPQNKKTVSHNRNHNERFFIDKNDDNGEMTEEEMIAEDYYFYKDDE